MSKGLLFWIVYVLVVVFGLWHFWPSPLSATPYGVVMLLVGLIGWQVFGPPVK